MIIIMENVFNLVILSAKCVRLLMNKQFVYNAQIIQMDKN